MVFSIVIRQPHYEALAAFYPLADGLADCEERIDALSFPLLGK
jgi:hypothetical protein